MSFLGFGGSKQPATPATQTQFVREAPGIEERKIELMDIARQVAQRPIDLPDVQVAPLTALEQQGLAQAAATGVGADTVNKGIAALEAGVAPIGAAQISQFFNPFQDAVNQEILRQSQGMQDQIAAQAIRSGAFGGGREGVQQAELQKRTLEAIGRSNQMGFTQALQAAQNQQRTQLAGGQQLANVGAGQQQMAQADINQLFGAGGIQRQLAQQALDAQRASTLQQLFEPFQRAEFLANLYAQGPKTQSGITMGTAPSTSPLAQAVGTGIGAFAAFSPNQKG